MPPVQRRTPPPPSKDGSPPPGGPPEISAGENYPLQQRQSLQLRMQAAFVDLDELTSTDGFFAIISQKRKDGSITFGVWKQFLRQGALERTSFIPADIGEKFVRFVQIVLERIDRIKADGNLPFAVYAENPR